MTLCLSATVEENDLVSGHRFSLHLSSIPPPPSSECTWTTHTGQEYLQFEVFHMKGMTPAVIHAVPPITKKINKGILLGHLQNRKRVNTAEFHLIISITVLGRIKKGTLANTWFMPLHWWISWKLRFCKFVTLRKLIFSQNKTWSMVIRIPGFLFSLTYFMTIKTTAMKATISTRALMKKLR